MCERFKTVLIFGAPGVGKGTQGKTLAAIPGFRHCASGDVFRSVDCGTDLGKTFFEYSSRGELVPDDLTVRVWHEAMLARVEGGNYRPSHELLVLDGIPRTPKQVNLMNQYIEVLAVIHLTCSEVETLVQRLLRRALKENRADDADENVIRRRWDVYEQQTRPVLEHYPDDIIAHIDGLGTPAQVLASVLQVVAPIQARHFDAFQG